MARILPRVCPFLVTVDLNVKWPELPRTWPELPRPTLLTFVRACRRGLPGNEWSQCSYIAGNECSLGFDRVAENERIDDEPRTPGSTAGQRSSRRSVSSLRSSVHVHVAMKVNFALEQPSSTGVGHELVRSDARYSSSKLTHKDTFMSMTMHWEGELNTRIHAVTIWNVSMCAVLHTMLYQGIHVEHMLWLIPLQHHTTPLLPVVYFGVE